jgi:K+-transporting ATPase ATPase C chain
MAKHFSKSILLLTFGVFILCVLYPVVLWAVGQTFFKFQADGSMVKGPDGQLVGSLLIAQPFTKDEYFQPRPSAASFDASASASSALAPSNYALRDRVARQIGPIAKYADGPKAGQLVAPDVEAWFQKDTFQGQPHIVAQWADAHNSLAQAWPGADPKNDAYIQAWSKANADIVKQWIKDNPDTPQPASKDLAVVFFENFSTKYPGQFPSAITTKDKNGKDQTVIGPVKSGSDIQSIFFELWREDHPDVNLQQVPGDMVTTSASGLDPHITLQNAEFQLDRVASKWATDTKRDTASVKPEIEAILEKDATAPFGGLAGEKIVNVLQVNLELRGKYGPPQ